MKRIVLLVLLVVSFNSCKESLPPELQKEKEWVNKRMEEFISKEESSEEYKKSTRIIVDLEMMKKNNLHYKEMLESKGLGDRFNPEVIAFIDEKLNLYANNGKSDDNMSSTKHTCNICGKRFVGSGYEEVSTGLWQPTKEPYQSFICSRACGAIHTEKQVKRYGF